MSCGNFHSEGAEKPARRAADLFTVADMRRMSPGFGVAGSAWMLHLFSVSRTCKFLQRLVLTRGEQAIMKVTINRVKSLAMALLATLPLLAAVLLSPASVKSSAAVVDEKAATDLYAAKCKMCHGAKAEKFFDPSNRTDDQMAESVLKGKKGEKPPYMPGFGDKGVDSDQAKALVTYMKSLKQ